MTTINLQIDSLKKTHVIVIDSFNEQLKNKIRADLSSICHGSSKPTRNPTLYSYKSTLTEFLKRYDGKPKSTKIGMIGELLTHTLMSEVCPELIVASPFFNMEEASIKKGFDIVYFNKNNHTTWLSEVKSSQSSKHTSTKASKLLLGLAYRDLKSRVFKQNQTIWHNAINAATIALLENKTKEVFLNILDEYLNESTSKKGKKDLNIIISGVLFNINQEDILIDEVGIQRIKFENEKKFQAVFSISIKKKIFQEIENFLREEAN